MCIFVRASPFDVHTTIVCENNIIMCIHITFPDFHNTLLFEYMIEHRKYTTFMLKYNTLPSKYRIVLGKYLIRLGKHIIYRDNYRTLKRKYNKLLCKLRTFSE